MKSVEFCYWLQGYFELANLKEGAPIKLDAEQTECIRRHLALVFMHEIDPSYPKEQQAKLNEQHGSVKLQIGGEGPDGTIFRC